MSRTQNIDASNGSNNGKGFEDLIKSAATIYAHKRICRIEKVDPPVKVTGFGRFQKVIFLKNPFLDFVGTWTARGGRGLFVEAKSHQGNRMPINRDSGVSPDQVNSMVDWACAGAAVCVLWHRPDVGGFRLITLSMVAKIVTAKEASIAWGDCIPIDPTPANPVPFMSILDEVYFRDERNEKV